MPLAAHRPFASGAAADLLLRPERVRVGEVCDVDVKAMMAVETLINYGESLLAIGKLRGRAFRVRIAGQAPAALREGVEVPVGWQADDMHVIGASSRSAN